MSYQEKRNITSISTNILLLAAYLIYVFNPDRLSRLMIGGLRSWSITMLVFIGIGIVVSIIIQIVFHILLSVSIAVKTKIEDLECDEQAIARSVKSEIVQDERDKLIGLKSNEVGFIVAGIGFISALIALAFNTSPEVMLNIIFIAFSIGSTSEGIAQLVYYRKGV